jgi:NIMA (never in mitosis gene a)-related kinase
MVWKKVPYGHMSDKQKHNLTNELNILRELKHENIVRYYDKINDRKSQTLYIVMEYCPGGDLSQMIAKCREIVEKQGGTGYIKEDDIWTIFMHIVLALFECHRKKDKKVILHRDLKPSNIFLDARKIPKLGDFGFAKELNLDKTDSKDQAAFASTYLGSPNYMSPE